jgi:membrane protein DedA with SNARE-associated domain
MDQSVASVLGYAAILVGCIVEGETVLITAGLAAQGGYLSLPLVVLFAWIGAVSGDHFFFMLGRWKGRSAMRLRPSWNDGIEKTLRLVDRHGRLLIFGCRFLCGFRAAGPFAIGTARVRIGRFSSLNVFSGLVWSALFALTSYYSGVAIRPFVAGIRLPLIVLIFALGCMVFVVVRRLSPIGKIGRIDGTAPAHRSFAGRFIRFRTLSQGRQA